MSSRIFQSVVLQMKDSTERAIGVIDSEGTVVACNELSCIGEHWPNAVEAVNRGEGDIVRYDGRTFKALAGWGSQFDYAVFVKGEDAEANMVCSMAAVALNGAKTYYEEKHDKATFVKNIISDNILLGDIYVRAKELHFISEAPRAVFLIRQVESTDPAVIEQELDNWGENYKSSKVLSGVAKKLRRCALVRLTPAEELKYIGIVAQIYEDIKLARGNTQLSANFTDRGGRLNFRRREEYLEPLKRMHALAESVFMDYNADSFNSVCVRSVCGDYAHPVLDGLRRCVVGFENALDAFCTVINASADKYYDEDILDYFGQKAGALIDNIDMLAAWCMFKNISARLDEGTKALVITGPDPTEFFTPSLAGLFPPGNYHVVELNFFYRNLQQNVKERAVAFFDLQSSVRPR